MDDYTQPTKVSPQLTNYLRMTDPHRPRPVKPNLPPQLAPRRHPINNDGLTLENGNDFA